MFCGFFISIRPSPVPTFAKHRHRPYPSPAFHQLFHGKHPRLPLLFRERTDFPRRYFPSNSHKAPRYNPVAWRFHIDGVSTCRLSPQRPTAQRRSYPDHGRIIIVSSSSFRSRYTHRPANVSMLRVRAYLEVCRCAARRPFLFTVVGLAVK